MAVAEASFNTSIDSISCGLIKFKGSPPPVLELSKGNPSTTKRGVLPVLTPPGPLTVIPVTAPGSPLLEVTFTPATFPCNNCCGEVMMPLLKDSAFNDFTEPVTSLLFCVPYPTTTTCANSEELGCKDTSMLVFVPTATSCGTKPT